MAQIGTDLLLRSLLQVASGELNHTDHEHDEHEHEASAGAYPAAGLASLDGTGAAEAVDTHGHSHAETIKDCEGSPTLVLRIVAIFVIMAAALLAGLPPLYLKYFRAADAFWARITRVFSGGVILALAAVHIIPETVEQLGGLISYHGLAGVTLCGGILLLVIIDSALAAWHTDPVLPESGSWQAGGKLGDSADSIAGDSTSHHKHAREDLEAAGPHEPHAGRAHAHQCMRMTSQQFVSAGSVAASARAVSMRQFVTAYTMELGCIFHSVLIGVGLGVIVCDVHLVTTLLIALAIHQALEGLALSTVLALTDFSAVKKTLMVVTYALVTPLGIAIGIAVSSSYDPETSTSRAVQGVLNGLSAGMLLYIAMYQLIGEEFSRQDLNTQRGLRYSMYTALLLGAATMAVIGIWA